MNFAEKLQYIERLLQSGRTKEARLSIDRLIHEDPSNVEVWYWRGVCEKFEGEFELAEKDFRDVICQKPNHDRAFYGLGVVLENKGNLKDAIAAYQQAALLGHKQALKKLAQYEASHVADRPTVASHPAERRPANKVIEPIVKPSVELHSERGIDYTRLRDLLAANKWRAADKETERLMLYAGGSNKSQWGKTFPCADLKTIDNLWMQLSKGRFGFSVQKEIWQSLGGTRKFNSTIWNWFGNRVGWFDKGHWLCDSELSFEESDPRGHLPVGIWAPLSSQVGLNLLEAWWMLPANQKRVKDRKRESGWHGADLIGILSRLENCKSEIAQGINMPSVISAEPFAKSPKQIESFWYKVAVFSLGTTALIATLFVALNIRIYFAPFEIGTGALSTVDFFKSFFIGIGAIFGLRWFSPRPWLNYFIFLTIIIVISNALHPNIGVIVALALPLISLPIFLSRFPQSR
jgi:tetratricopeptide (TPR) repeat protein